MHQGEKEENRSEKQQGQKTEKGEEEKKHVVKENKTQWAKKLEQKHKEKKKSSSITVPECYICIQSKLFLKQSQTQGGFFVCLFWGICLFGFVSLLSKIVKLQFLRGFKFGLPFLKVF